MPGPPLAPSDRLTGSKCLVCGADTYSGFRGEPRCIACYSKEGECKCGKTVAGEAGA